MLQILIRPKFRMKKKLQSCAHYGCIFSLVITLLSGCGDGNPPPVPGTAIPVPGTESPVQTSNPGRETKPNEPALPTQTNTEPVRFTNVAPVTSDNASFVPSPAIAYDLGNLVAQSGTDNSILITPVRGWVRYPIASTALPRTTTRFPVIVFLHGNHDPRDPSYQGYD